MSKSWIRTVLSFFLFWALCPTSWAVHWTVSIIDGVLQAPISGAEVWVNATLLRTGDDGKVSAEGTFPDVLSVYHPDYSPVTYQRLTQAGHEIKIPLPPKRSVQTPVSLQGTTLGFGNLKQSKIASVALVSAAPGILDLLALEEARFLAPPVSMRVGPLTLWVPGNIDIPGQDKLWKGIIPVHLDKPGFTLQPQPAEETPLFALESDIPFDLAVETFRSKRGLAELVNAIQHKQLSAQMVPSSSSNENITLHLQSKLLPTVKADPEPPIKGWDRVLATVVQHPASPLSWVPVDFRVFRPGTHKKPITLNGTLDWPEPVAVLSAYTQFPDQFATRPESLSVTARMAHTTTLDSSSAYLPIPEGRRMQAQSLHWNHRSITPTVATATVQLHVILLPDGQSWFVVQPGQDNQLALPAWPTHWPKLSVAALKDWSLIALKLSKDVDLNHFNINDWVGKITHASIAKNF